MEAGQDADICKRSDTDLERFLWLAREHRREAPTWLSEHGGGDLQPTDSTCTFRSSMFTARWSLEITGIFSFFFFVFVIYNIFSRSRGVNPFGFGVIRTEHNFSSVLGIKRGYKTASLALLEGGPSAPLVPLLHPIALCSGWKPRWQHTEP